MEEVPAFVDFAYEKQTEELLFQRWIPYQYLSFDDFKAKIKPQIIKNDEEILKDVKDIITLFNKKGEEHGNI